ncbi:hypothetical protein Pve01_40130 [Planomonospora venezuelensis]|nr:hypothetical protein Pve01_40130 [Planomonospora venezuelensis]
MDAQLGDVRAGAAGGRFFDGHAVHLPDSGRALLLALAALRRARTRDGDVAGCGTRWNAK